MDPNQDTRLSVLESQVTTITNSVGKLETKVESNYATLHHRISDLRDDFHNNLETKTNKIFEKITSEMVKFDQSKDNNIYDDTIKETYKKIYVTSQYIFKDDTIKTIKNKIINSINNS